MKRLIICILMFVFVIAVACVGTLTVKKQSDALLKELDAALAAVEEENQTKALTCAKKIESLWQSSRLPLFVFLDHTLFSELNQMLPHLTEILSDPLISVKEQLLRCRGILEDLLLHQRVSIGNIL